MNMGIIFILLGNLEIKEKLLKFPIKQQQKRQLKGKLERAFNRQRNYVFQCQNFSGVYSVKEHKKKSMSFESNSTIGFSGKKVVIKIEKK